MLEIMISLKVSAYRCWVSSRMLSRVTINTKMASSTIRFKIETIRKSIRIRTRIM